MAMSFDASPLRDFVRGLAGGATTSDFVRQAIVAAAAFLLAWLATRALTRRFTPGAKWKFGEGDFGRVAFPLFSYALLFAGALALARLGYRVTSLDIVASLLVAWLVIRVAVYMLGHVLPQGSFLRASIRAIAWIAWIGVGLYLTGLLPGVIEALDDVGFAIGKDRQRITLWLVLQALAALFLTLAVAAWISRVTESRVLAAQSIEMSTRVVITKLVRVATLFVAVLVALPMVGIDITALSIFSGALGVGLGFGLQKIASNYVSGFIVLLDRSLRIGDLVTVDNRRGVVTAIESRYTVIKGADGTESIIPNEKLITESVSHHTYSDPRHSVVLPVVVSYESDLDRALAVLLECAAGSTGLIADPAPVARVKGLKDDGVEVELVAWIANVAEGDAAIRSDLIRDILRRFAGAGIEIPYPRRDVRLVATPEIHPDPLKSRV